MVDTFSHGAMLALPAVALTTASESLFGIKLFDPMWLTVLVLGSIIPDIVGEPALWYARYHRFGRRRKWWRLWRYDEQMTRELNVLEHEHPAMFLPYKVLHSMWGTTLITISVWFFFGWWLAFAWGLGHFVHGVVDVYTHKVSWPWWPLGEKPSRWADRDWWNTWYYRHNFVVAGVEMPTVYVIVVPLDAAGITYLSYLHNLPFA